MYFQDGRFRRCSLQRGDVREIAWIPLYQYSFQVGTHHTSIGRTMDPYLHWTHNGSIPPLDAQWILTSIGRTMDLNLHWTHNGSIPPLGAQRILTSIEYTMHLNLHWTHKGS